MSGEPVDFAAAGLLDGLGAAERAARLRLLERLHADGHTVPELQRAVEENRLVLLPLERVLGGRRGITPAAIAEETGVSVEALLATRAALGLPVPEPDAPALGEAELHAARRFRAAVDLGMPEEGLVDLNRVLGRAMGQVAAAIRQTFGGAYIEPGDAEDDLAQRLATAAEALLPHLGPALQNIFALHLMELLRGAAIDAADRERGGVDADAPMAVAFADLVGFTWLGTQIPSDELGRIARRLEELATAAARSPVRLVKTIGDAVMLVSPRPAPLLETVIDLVAAAKAEGEDFPLLRAGVAFGDAHDRDADVFGRAVNLASRVTALAKPDSILVEEELKAAIADEGGAFRFSFAGARKVRGVQGEVKVFRARRSDP